METQIGLKRGTQGKKKKKNLNGFIYLQTRETTVQAHGLC